MRKGKRTNQMKGPRSPSTNLISYHDTLSKSSPNDLYFSKGVHPFALL